MVRSFAAETRSSSAWRSGRCWRAGPQEPLEVRLGDATLVGSLDEQETLARLLRLGREDVVRRDEPLVEARAQVTDVRADHVQCLGDDLLGLAGRHQRPEGTRDLEPEVGARRGEIRAGGVVLCLRGTLQGVKMAGSVDRPLEVDAGAVVVGNVRVNDRPRPPGCEDRKLGDVVGPRVAAEQRHRREACCGTSLLGRRGRGRSGLELREALAVREALRQRVLERQRRARRGWLNLHWRLRRCLRQCR